MPAWIATSRAAGFIASTLRLMLSAFLRSNRFIAAMVPYRHGAARGRFRGTRAARPVNNFSRVRRSWYHPGRAGCAPSRPVSGGGQSCSGHANCLTFRGSSKRRFGRVTVNRLKEKGDPVATGSPCSVPLQGAVMLRGESRAGVKQSRPRSRRRTRRPDIGRAVSAWETLLPSPGVRYERTSTECRRCSSTPSSILTVSLSCS